MDEERIRQIFREELIKILGTYASIPFEVDGAFRERFNIDSLAELEVSSKAVSSATQQVDEAGTGNFDVSALMDGFLEFTPAGSTSVVHIPYFNT